VILFLAGLQAMPKGGRKKKKGEEEKDFHPYHAAFDFTVPSSSGS